MARPAITVHVAGLGQRRALVYEDDPAYAVAVFLKKQGVKTIRLPIETIRTGLLPADYPLPQEAENLEDWETFRQVHAAKEAEPADCVHHWVIETPQASSATEHGVCKRCHAERDFRPRFREDIVWVRPNGETFRNVPMELSGKRAA